MIARTKKKKFKPPKGVKNTAIWTNFFSDKAQAWAALTEFPVCAMCGKDLIMHVFPEGYRPLCSYTQGHHGMRRWPKDDQK